MNFNAKMILVSCLNSIVLSDFYFPSFGVYATEREKLIFQETTA